MVVVVDAVVDVVVGVVVAVADRYKEDVNTDMSTQVTDITNINMVARYKIQYLKTRTTQYEKKTIAGTTGDKTFMHCYSTKSRRTVGLEPASTHVLFKPVVQATTCK